MQKFLFVICLLAAGVLIQACGGGKNLQNAYEKQRVGAHTLAIDEFKRAYTSAPREKKAEIAFRVAENFREIDNYKQAETWYRRAIQLGYNDPIVYLRLVDVLKMAGSYDEAIVELQNYKKEQPSAEGIDEEIEWIKQVQHDIENPGCRYTIDAFRDANSASRDYGPVLHEKDGLYFSSDRPDATGKQEYGRTEKENGTFDIFLLPKTTTGRGAKKIEKWEKEQLAPVTGINTDWNEGTVVFDDRGSQVYYTQCNGEKGDKAKPEERIPNCRILTAHKTGKEWSRIDTLPFTKDTMFNFGHPALSPDGEKLIYTRVSRWDTTAEGAVKHDLYLVTYQKRSRSWGDPIALESLNTNGREMFPFWYNDTTLYFSSDGYPSYGGLDIYVTYGSGNTWSEPVNLKYPINSGGDDFGIFWKKNRNEGGYLTSNRQAIGEVPGAKLDDIYEIRVNPLSFAVTGTIYDTTNVTNPKPLGNATVNLNIEGKSPRKVTTNREGQYRFELSEGEYYMLYAEKAQYLNSREANMTTAGYECSRDTVIDLNMARLPIDAIPIEGIFYDLDKATIKPESKRALDSLIYVLETYPYITIELASHTDCRASYEYNEDLSQRRAESVVKYLDSAGIDLDRLTPKGYGERKLVNNCACEPNDVGPGAKCTEEEHQANRRTTFQILRMDYVPKVKPKEKIEEPEPEPEQPEGGEGQDDGEGENEGDEEDGEGGEGDTETNDGE